MPFLCLFGLWIVEKTNKDFTGSPKSVYCYNSGCSDCYCLDGNIFRIIICQRQNSPVPVLCLTECARLPRSKQNKVYLYI